MLNASGQNLEGGLRKRGNRLLPESILPTVGRRNQSLQSQNLLASSDAAVSLALVAEPVSLLSESHLCLIARYCLVEGHSQGVQVGFLGEGEPASHVGVDCDGLGEQFWPSALRLNPSLAGLVRAPDAG